MNSLVQAAELIQRELNDRLAKVIAKQLELLLSKSLPGHCLRVAALPEAVMRQLCDQLSNVTNADVVLLLGPGKKPKEPWEVSSTRLIQLRNSGTRPLLAFIPPGLKAAAEDSFDISTFTELDLGNTIDELRKELQDQFAEDVHSFTAQVIAYLETKEHWIDSDAIVRYYITIQRAGGTIESAGSAIYQLGLVPHFGLGKRADHQIEPLLAQNISAVQVLVAPGGPLLARIHQLKLKTDTLQADLYAFLRHRTTERIKDWTSEIATVATYRHLAFDNWQFESEVADRSLALLFVEQPSLPIKSIGEPPGPDNPLYLDIQKQKTVRILWETRPKPAAIHDLSHFRVEIVSADRAVVWESKKIRSTSTRSTRSTTIKLADFRDQIEDGIYFFRIRAYSQTGDTLNDEGVDALRDQQNPEGKKINETDDIWFWVDKNGTPPPAEPQRNLNVNSFLEAELHARFAALDRGEDPLGPQLSPDATKTGWAVNKSKRGEASYNIVYDAQTRFTLSVSMLLRQLELETLAKPGMLGRWRVRIDDDQLRPTPHTTERQFTIADGVPPSFLAARVALFEAIRGSSKEQITSTVDLVRFEILIEQYSDAYSGWLEQVKAHFDTQAVRDENGYRRTESVFLDLDTVELLLPARDSSQTQERVYLLAPTHPVRLLWHLQRAKLARAWITQATEAQAPERLDEEKRRFLREGLVPINLPLVLRVSHDSYPQSISRFYVEQGPITLFWGLYIREDIRDTRALHARVQRALGVKGNVVSDFAVGGANKTSLADKLNQYLIQHPYIRTLKLNVFNPGDANLVVDAMLLLEKQRADAKLPSLRYELKLFSHFNHNAIGQALDDLLNPERQVSAEADAFTQPSVNHLFPKLRFSRNELIDFLENPKAYEAHVSILHDAFAVRVDLDATGSGRSSFLHGLIQDPVTTFTGVESSFAWQRQVIPSNAPDLVSSDVSRRIAHLMELIGCQQASVAAGRLLDQVVPTLRLELTVGDQSFLYLVHDVSDWVFIIDRHLGLDYFDSEGGDRSVYLLDFTPEFSATDVDRLLLTTRAVDEVTRLIQPELQRRSLPADDQAVLIFLQSLRSLSGRLAFKMIGAPTAVGEAMGLGMARLFLEQYGLLEDRIVIPLDAHADLFQESSGVANDLTAQRGDLLLVSCQMETRVLHFQIVEVKWRSTLPDDLNAYLALRQYVENQLDDSERSLRWHFDPNLDVPDRLDRQLKNRQLVSLLTFYLARSRRYGLVNSIIKERLSRFISTLDDGYRIQVSLAGLIFDFGGVGILHEEEHAGLKFHRIGRDYVEKLLHNAINRREKLRGYTPYKPSSIEDAQETAERVETIVRDTSMSGDPSFERVRTHFTQQDSAASEQKQEIVHEDHKDDTATEPSVDGEKTPPMPGSPSHDVSQLDIGKGEQVADTQSQEATPLERQPSFDILLGETQSNQYGLLGQAADKIIALDLAGTNTISLFGIQGGGKSYTVGSVLEMATQPIEGINRLPSPLASVVFHYHENQDYPPEFATMVSPNSRSDELEKLATIYNARPVALSDVIILTPADKVGARKAEFPTVSVLPIFFSSNELTIKDWRFLMGVLGNQMYMKQINMIMRNLRERLTLDALGSEIEASELSDAQKTIARQRLRFAAEFINDGHRLSDAIHPGRLIIVDLRDEFIDKDEALGLFVVMLNIFANAGRQDGYNKLIVFDEAHKYMDNPDLTAHIVEVIRQMRHQGVSVMIASQDPPSLPNAIIELSSIVILHRFNSPQWLKHVQRSITALADLTSTQMAALRPGEAFVWATKATERVFTQKAVRVVFRPRVTQHGGATRKVG